LEGPRYRKRGEKRLVELSWDGGIA
jgi:hypothetical protein